VSQYSEATLSTVRYYKERKDEIYCGHRLGDYGWYRFLMDADFVSQSKTVNPPEGEESPNWSGYTFDQLYAVLQEFDLYPEMLEIMMERRNSFDGVSITDRSFDSVLVDFTEFLIFKHGPGFLVPMAKCIAIDFAVSEKNYANGIGDFAFKDDLKSGVFGDLGNKEG